MLQVPFFTRGAEGQWHGSFKGLACGSASVELLLGLDLAFASEHSFLILRLLSMRSHSGQGLNAATSTKVMAKLKSY